MLLDKKCAVADITIASASEFPITVLSFLGVDGRANYQNPYTE
jgi:hypothetical protein